MTIKELETLVGMTRANIRFYEQEGLIAPARQSNGYRDYSREDADTLSKIKLFRQLHLDLDTIRRLQSEELTLAQALEKQLAELETDQAALDRARQVCQGLRESGTSYATLDPRPWLDELERPAVPASPRYTPPADQYVPPESTFHPWRRYFARSIDLSICSIVWLAVYALGFHWRQSGGLGTTLLNVYVDWALLSILEPLCLHFWGTTPGKAIFGITIRNSKGEKLTLSQALRRTWQVFGKGMGYSIPFYNVWRLWKSYKACQEGEREPWEYMDDWDVWETYDIADDKAWRCWACVGVYVLDFGLTALILAQAMMPPNRGDLTAAEFYENYNFYVDYLGTGGKRLDENGQWMERTDSGAVIIDLAINPEVEFDVTLTDGAVTGVTITQYAEDADFLWISTTEQELAVLALAGSLPEINCINFKAGNWVKVIEQQTNWDYDLTLRGLLHVAQDTKLSGFPYQDSYTNYLISVAGQDATFWQEFRIELAG